MALRGKFFFLHPTDICKRKEVIRWMIDKERNKAGILTRTTQEVMDDLLHDRTRLVVRMDGAEIIFLCELKIRTDAFYKRKNEIRIMEILCVAANLGERSEDHSEFMAYTKELIEFIDELSVKQGCHKMISNSRMGWSRILNKCGFDIPTATYIKQV